LSKHIEYSLLFSNFVKLLNINLRFLDANLLRQVQHLAIRMETTWNYTKRTYRSCSFFFNSYTHMVETNTNPFTKLKSSLLFWVPVQLSPNQAPFCGTNPPVLTMVGKDQFASCSLAINLPRAFGSWSVFTATCDPKNRQSATVGP
jgi:hypothetical protein